MAQPARSQSFVAVQKVPLILRKHFCKAPPPTATGDFWGMADDQTTFWAFTIKPTLGANALSLEQMGKSWNAQIQVTSACCKIGLIMDIYLGEHKTASDSERQAAYALICQSLYKNSESTAQEVANRIFAQKFSADGPDAESALNNAMNKAVKSFEYRYFLNCGNTAQRVARAYDLVCAQKTVPKLSAAIALSFRVAELNPSMFNKPKSKSDSRPPRPFSREFPPR